MPLGGFKWNWIIGNLVQFMSEGSVLIFVTKKQNCEEFGHNLALKEFKCKVIEVKEGAVKVHFVGWSAVYDEWVSTEGEDKLPFSGENETGDENSDQREDSSGDQSEMFSKTF